MRNVLFVALFVSFTIAANADYSPLDSRRLYNEIHLDNVVSYALFEQAIAGYNKIDVSNKDIITLIDFTKPSTVERLFVVDLKNKKLLFSSLVAHGKKSGENYATSFSNKMGSHQSSLGFFVTEGTYEGRNGYSLVIDGLEPGINDKAKERSVVIHGADYANPSVLQSSNRLGRSFGCPALPQDVNDSIINTIKDGTILFVYADKYLAKSSILAKANTKANIKPKAKAKTMAKAKTKTKARG